MNKDKKNNYISEDLIRYATLLGILGFTIIANILIFIFLYKLIEKFLFASNLLFIIMIILGVISGFYSVYKMIFYKKNKNF